MVNIKGIRCNCEAAKRQIEAIVDSSMKRKSHSQSEVCAWDVLIYAVNTISFYVHVSHSVML